MLLGAACLYMINIIHRKRKAKKLLHQNPSVQHENRLPPHVPLGAYIVECEARAHIHQNKCSTFVCDLGGIWKFILFPDFESGIDHVLSGNNGLESNIVVPGQWQLQCVGDLPSFPSPSSANSNIPRKVPRENPTGYFSTCFSIPSHWKDRKLILQFGGVDSAFYVWLNGTYVGFAKDSRSACEFDITDVPGLAIYTDSSHSRSRPGTNSDASTASHTQSSNLLQVLVLRYSDGSWVENQPTWHMSGLYRDVILYSLPNPLHIADYSWNTSIELSSYAPMQGRWLYV